METFLGLPCPPLPTLPARRPDSHKGDFGHALIIGGSRGMTGAISLTGLAALHCGAGLVTLAIPDRCLESVAAHSPCLMTIPLPDDDSGRVTTKAFDTIAEKMKRATCVAIGPGMGRSRDLQILLGQILRIASCPVVIDADGLNNLAQFDAWQFRIGGPTVITPHPGEWSRLCRVDTTNRDEQRNAAVATAGKSKELTIVLKGNRTLITDGRTATLNQTGSPAMSVGGSGDVLTGIIVALICQGLTPRDAAHLGAHVHGKAADLAVQTLRSHVVLPTELIQYIRPALAEHIYPDSPTSPSD